MPLGHLPRWSSVSLLAAGWLLIACCSISSAARAEYAAIDPNSEAVPRVVWGATEAEAVQRAIDACAEVSQTCAESPAFTDELTDVFAYVCCDEPEIGCAVAPGSTRAEASSAAEKVMTDDDASVCGVRFYLSAKTGRQISFDGD